MYNSMNNSLPNSASFLFSFSLLFKISLCHRLLIHRITRLKAIDVVEVYWDDLTELSKPLFTASITTSTNSVANANLFISILLL